MDSRLIIRNSLFPYLQRSFQNCIALLKNCVKTCHRTALLIATKTSSMLAKLTKNPQKTPISEYPDFSSQISEIDGFVETYEDMIELLCIMAHQGAREDRLIKYELYQKSAMVKYGNLRANLKPYWESSELTFQSDPFQAILFCKSAESLANSENGIELICRAREALEAYRNSLTVGASMSSIHKSIN